MVAMNCSE